MDEFEYIVIQNLANARIARSAIREMRPEGIIVTNLRRRLMLRNLSTWIHQLETSRHIYTEDDRLERIRERAERVLEGENWWHPSHDEWDDGQVEASALTEETAARWILKVLDE